MKTKLIILLLLLICCGCTQHLTDDKGIVTRIEYSYQEGIYNVYLESLDVHLLCCNPLEIGKDFFFETRNSSYHIGDTVKFVVR